MSVSDLTPSFPSYARQIVDRTLSIDILTGFPTCRSWLAQHTTDLPDWQIALPAIACLATGGSFDDGISVASAWYLLCLASDVFDHVEDGEFMVTDDGLCSSGEATNLGTGLIFLSFHGLSSLEDAAGATRCNRIFSDLGFTAARGQHQDLGVAPLTVGDALEKYWDTIVLKSGSVFRASMAGGAACGTPDAAIVNGLGDYGTALGVMLQLLDDCKDVFKVSNGTIDKWEISLPLLFYLMASEKDEVIFPVVNTRAEWHKCLREAGVVEMLSSILLQWQKYAVTSIQHLPLAAEEKKVLEALPGALVGPAILDGEK